MLPKSVIIIEILHVDCRKQKTIQWIKVHCLFYFHFETSNLMIPLLNLPAMGVEAARSIRTGSVPERGTAKKKLLTRSIWLNNNKLKSIKNLEVIVESVLEVPSQLSWIDFSFNYIKEVDDCILNYPNLKIIYLHGNCISKLSEVMKLRKLKNLRTVTFHGNPISNIPLYRVSIMHMLPQVS